MARASGWWRGQRAPVKDVVFALVLGAGAAVPALAVFSAQIGDLPRREGDWFTLLLTVLQVAPLTVRTRWPAVCLAVVGTAFAVHQVLAYPPTFASLGLHLAVYAVGAHLHRHRAWAAGTATAGYAALALVLAAEGSPMRVGDFVLFYLALTAVWLAGAGVRRWRADEAARRALTAAAAVGAERARIARELHDVVTHHVTAMVVQADAARVLLDAAPDKAGRGLDAISGTGRQALAELRALLGVLEATSAADGRTPVPGRVADLVERARAGGQPVRHTETGAARDHPADVDLAVYRVVQEALTNAAKYAAGKPTSVEVRHRADRVEVDVVTEGASAAPPVPSGGRGLAGLAERLRLLGGTLEAGPVDGGFAVRAILPADHGS